MTRFLITGATGFLGTALTGHLLEQGHQVTACHRRPLAEIALPPGVDSFHHGDLQQEVAWEDALADVDVVVHLAGRVHQMKETAADAEVAYQLANVEATAALARQAALSSARRMVFASSVKAMGEATTPGSPWTPDSACHPLDPYGRSKLAAERSLARICEGSRLEFSIARLPLVYGPGVRANFLRLLEVVARGSFVPAGITNNRRSFLGVRNFCSAIEAIASHPAAAGQTYLLSDGISLSTGALIEKMAQALGARPRSLPLPTALLRLLGPHGRRLVSSLEVSSASLEQSLDWQPPFSMEEELAATVAWYRQQQEAR